MSPSILEVSERETETEKLTSMSGLTGIFGVTTDRPIKLFNLKEGIDHDQIEEVMPAPALDLGRSSPETNDF